MVIFEHTWFDDWMSEWTVSSELVAWWAIDIATRHVSYAPYHAFYGHGAHVYTDDRRNYHTTSTAVLKCLSRMIPEFVFSSAL